MGRECHMGYICVSHSEFGCCEVRICIIAQCQICYAFYRFLGQTHTDREEGASSSLLYKRTSRCQHVSSLSRLNKTILAHYSRFNKIATLGYIMGHEGMGTDHYSMSRLTMRRSNSSTGHCYNICIARPDTCTSVDPPFPRLGP